MSKKNLRGLRLAASAALLAAILACGAGEGATESDEEQASSAALRELGEHLSEGTTYGEGPGGEELARLVRETLAPGDGVAVRIVPGNPRNVTVLVRYSAREGYEELREISVSERNAEIDRIVEGIDGSYGAQADNLAVAIRGAVFYGAVGIRRAGSPIEYHTGSIVNLSVIDPILGATAGQDAPRPALTLGAQIEGTITTPNEIPPTFRLELTAETLFVTQLVTARSDEAPFLVLCRGEQRPWLCAEDESIQPLEEFSNDRLDELDAELEPRGRMLDYQAYRLPAGVYTAVVVPNCDADAPCPAAGTSYTLLATEPTR
jgi:hypothetical protein